MDVYFTVYLKGQILIITLMMMMYIAADHLKLNPLQLHFNSPSWHMSLRSHAVFEFFDELHVLFSIITETIKQF